MRKLFLAWVAVATVLFGATAASANSDPHRMFLPAGPFDIPAGVCTFPVHVDVPMNNEYAKVTTLPDGSTQYDITGAFKVTLTNVATGKMLSLNISGPQTIVFPASGSILSADLYGASLVYVTNGASFGLPNLMLTAGPFSYTTDTSNDTIVSVTRAPQVRTDVCAALG
jgi:hypothetical protein